MKRTTNPSRRYAPFTALLFGLLMLALATLACNLTTPPPPTVPPRQPTQTPQATIGISTQAPVDLPGGIVAEAPIAPNVESLLRQIDSARLMQHVSALAGFTTRHVNSSQTSDTQGIGAARRYIYDHLVQYAATSEGRMTVWAQPFRIEYRDVESLQHNVVATLQGTEPGAGVVVVGAHYDSTAYDVDFTQFAPGADDNATGIAALLEMARIMSQTSHRATIIFVAFSAEEVGRQGSQGFIDEYLAPYNIDVRAVLTLDTIGNIFGDGTQSNTHQIRVFSDEYSNSRSRQLSRAINLIASTYVTDLEVVIVPASDREGRWGDHMSFTASGYPAIRMIEGIEDPTRQNNSKDTIDHVNETYLAKAVKVALASLAVIGDGLQPPRNITLRDNTSSGSGYTLVWEPVSDATGYVIAFRQPDALSYNQILNVGPGNILTWNGLDPAWYETVAIASIDDLGRWGPFSEEVILR